MSFVGVPKLVLASSTIMRSRLRSAEQTGPRLGRQVGANDTEAA